MHYSKVSCTQCMHYHSCSQKTRMYVNYCGADFKRMQKNIDSATLECRARHGLLFTRNVLSKTSVATSKNTLYSTVQ